MDIKSFLFLMFIVFITSIIHSATGFGGALLLSPVLSLFISDSKEVTSSLVIMGIITNIIMLLRIKFEADIKQVLIMTFFSVFGILAGTYTLHSINTYAIKIAVGIITAATGLVLLFNYTVKLKKPHIAGGVTGFLSGFLNASSGLSGPPVVIFFSNQNISKNAFLSTVTLYSFFINIITLVTFVFSSTITMPAIRFTLFNLPCILTGSFLGIKISGKLNGPAFRKIVICMIITIGVFLIIRTILA